MNRGLLQVVWQAAGWWIRFKQWVCVCADILVAVINLGSNFLLELFEFVTRQGARQELRAPLHQFPHQPLDLLHKRPLVGLDRQVHGVTFTHTYSNVHKLFFFCLYSYHKELFPYGSPLSQRGGHLLHQGHLCRHHHFFIPEVPHTQRN